MFQLKNFDAVSLSGLSLKSWGSNADYEFDCCYAIVFHNANIS